MVLEKSEYMLKIASAHVSWVSANDLVMSSKVILHLQKKK